ncbi:hypothetical protein CRYUN_Cryun10bG0000200 [Craigia yunnanensis]
MDEDVSESKLHETANDDDSDDEERAEDLGLDAQNRNSKQQMRWTMKMVRKRNKMKGHHWLGWKVKLICQRMRVELLKIM